MRSLFLLTLAACGTTPTPTPVAPEPAVEPIVAPTPAPEAVEIPYAGMFQALPTPSAPAGMSDDVWQAQVALGQILYFDGRLSINDQISCNSCHGLDTFGVDNEPTSPGHDGTRGGRNSPTTLNAAVHISQFWDGRAADVEAQAVGPILNPIEMGMPDDAAVIAKLAAIEGYTPLFDAAFPGDETALTYPNVGAAIGAFERTLLTPAAFDTFLGGDITALSDEQRAGLDTFVITGCAACHMGVGVGGGMYQKLGLVVPYETADPGRFDVTGNEGDRFVFKVPSLRNIEHTAPYFHDGSIATLEEAVSLMATHQLNKELTDDEVTSIILFLKALSAAPDAAAATAPEMPS